MSAKPRGVIEMFSINRLHLYFLGGLWLFVHVMLLHRLGIRADLYDSQVYDRAADYFLAHRGFQVFHHVFYTFCILLIAFLKVIHADWINSYVFIQCFFSGFAALSLYRAAAVLFKDQNAGLISATIFICWWDVIQWNTAVMTESIACSLTVFVMLRLVQFRNTLKDHLVLIFLLSLSILTRPTGALLIFGAFVFLAIHHWHSFGEKSYLKILVPGGFALVTFIGVTFMFQFWDLMDQHARGNIVTYIDTIEGQQLYSESLRLDTSDLILPDPESPPLWKMAFFIRQNPIHFVTSAALKVFYLVTGTRPYFSTLHNAYAVVWLSIVYMLCTLGFLRVANRGVKYFCLSIIVASCLLIAVATVDWDNRFYVPMQPAIALLAGGGGAHFLQSMIVWKTR